MAKELGVGIIGCGNISITYLALGPLFNGFRILACADLNRSAAELRAKEYGVKAQSIEELLANDELDVIVNLTIPDAHFLVSKAILEAGKHVYSEKPLVLSLEEGEELRRIAKAKNLAIGCAPDTFLGGSHQTARALIDSGVLGMPVGGTATFMCPGHERWHPNPDFYYEVGGGPMLDMGPYYITDLVNLLGPVSQVAGFAISPRSERLITSQPRNGERIPVHIATHVAGVMAFDCGAVVQIGMSFDVADHMHVPLELYGTEGSLIVPDPNHFGGQVELLKKGGSFEPQETTQPYADGNYRSIGVADMAHAIRSDRPHRANGDLALHVLEVMEAFQYAADSGTTIKINTKTERPAPLSASLSDGQLAA